MSAVATAPRRRGAEYDEQRAVQRRSKTFEKLGDALAEATQIEIPAPVAEVRKPPRGQKSSLTAEAVELARQVYYLQHGSLMEAARVVTAAGLLPDEPTELQVLGRLRVWWQREGWPKRSTQTTFVLRDANHDGGLYRGRSCTGAAIGNGRAPKGKPCRNTALPDSDKCFQHDPRPEYVAVRRQHAEHLLAGRRRDLVPVQPFRDWLDQQREQLLSEARASGPVHPNQRGWGLVCQLTGMDQSILGRVMKGNHNRNDPSRSEQIKASTVEKYLAGTGTSFEDIYGHPPPESSTHSRCPSCGGPKDHQAKACRSCHEAQGAQCAYVGIKSGKRCPRRTTHPSGYCHKCRCGLEKRANPKPRRGRTSRVSPVMLIIALGEYQHFPKLAWVARQMWAANAAGCRDAYISQNRLTSGLVKRFARLGVRTVDDARRLREELVAEYGDHQLPERAAGDAAAAGLIPLQPFQHWLAARYEQELQARGHKRGCVAALSERLGIHPDTVSQWVRGESRTATVMRSTIDDALARWGDGTTYAALYGGDAS